jgi:hypothetical protein
MPRFVCNHNSTALTQFITPSGKVLKFDHGVLDTDEEGAKVIRAHALFGRVILEGDESVPAHSEPTPLPAAAVSETAALAQAIAHAYYCDDCDRTFTLEKNYRKHMERFHGAVKPPEGG